MVHHGHYASGMEDIDLIQWSCLPLCCDVEMKAWLHVAATRASVLSQQKCCRS
jgi:hypothetical protein